MLVREQAQAPQRRFTRVEYERLVALGMFEHERVELIRGVVREMSPQTDRHGWAAGEIVQLLVERIFALGLRDQFQVRGQSSFAATDDSEPEPDAMVIRRRPPGDELPQRAHLVVEVAVSSLAYDRSTKTGIYAEAGVPEYWIVDVAGNAVEVYTAPEHGTYRVVTRVERGGTLRPVELPGVAIDVRELLPRP